MKKLNIKWIFNSCLTVLLLISSSAYAAMWEVDPTSNRAVDTLDGSRFINDDSELRRLLNQVPDELSGQSLEIDLPMPDGSLAAYLIYESGIMQPGLAAKFPEIKSYVVRGIDHPGSAGRVDISSKGFRGMIATPFGRVFIDPETIGSNRYLARTNDAQSHSHGFQCGVYNLDANKQSPLRAFKRESTNSYRIPGSITAYRLAVSATPEYVAAVSTAAPSLSEAMAEINTAINRVNQIYERDLGIKLFLVADNDKLIDVQGNANFDNSNGPLLLSQNQNWIDSQIGSSSYDVGHIFSTGGGGVAQLGSVCGSSKAQGVTGLQDPTGDMFYIDFVAHELGHQFGGNHTFNGSTGSCGGNPSNRNGSTAFEPGSGSTIMAYANICGGENLQTESEATFHAGSIAEINAFVADTNTGGSCATILATTPANTDPVAADAIDRTIPMGTPFSLTGSATDVDGDTLSYQWDQLDAGTVPTTAATFNSDQGNNPLFRSNVPQTIAVRHFPSLANQLSLSSETGQILPVLARTLTFRMTARDCKSGQAFDDVRVTVDASSGPFRVTSHGAGTSPFNGTTQQIVSWNVANTDMAPVNCATVDIDLLTFSADKSTFADTRLATAVANNGTALVTIGDKSASTARFRVSCSDSDNVFYDISDADLNITGALALPTTGNSTALSNAAICGVSNASGSPTGFGVGGGGSGGGGAPHPVWLLVLLLLAGAGRPRACKNPVAVRAYIES